MLVRNFYGTVEVHFSLLWHKFMYYMGCYRNTLAHALKSTLLTHTNYGQKADTHYKCVMQSLGKSRGKLKGGRIFSKKNFL